MSTYILVIVLIAAAVAAWYVTRNTPSGQMVGKGALVVILVALVILSFNGSIPILGRLLGTVKGWLANKEIKKLDAQNAVLASQVTAGVTNAAAIQAHANELTVKAAAAEQTARALEEQATIQQAAVENTPDPRTVAEAATPELTGNEDADLANLINEASRRKEERKGGAV